MHLKQLVEKSRTYRVKALTVAGSYRSARGDYDLGAEILLQKH